MSKHLNFLFVLICLSVFTGCSFLGYTSNWKQSYRNCPVSGQAYYYGIPLASKEDHQQAELFKPVDPSNCMIYVIRSDRTGSKSAPAKIFLYSQGSEPPVLPPVYWPWFGTNTLIDPQWSARHIEKTSRELHNAEIFSREVYAAWELSPGIYVLDASIDMLQPFARASVQCIAGRSSFWDVTPKDFLSARAKLREIGADDGKELVNGQLRSVGMQPGGPFTPGRISKRDCK